MNLLMEGKFLSVHPFLGFLRQCRVGLVLYDPVDGAACHSSQVKMKENGMQRHLPGLKKLTQPGILLKISDIKMLLLAQACRIFMHKISADKKGGRHCMSRFFLRCYLRSG